MSKPKSTQIISQLKAILPEAFSPDGKLDFEKIVEIVGDECVATNTTIDDKLMTKNQNQNFSDFISFFNIIDDFFFVLDYDGTILHLNNAASQRLGFGVDELLGQSILNVHPLDRKDDVSRILASILDGKTGFCSVPFLTKSDTLIPVETRVNRANWHHKSVIFCVSKDMTQIKFSEEKFSKAFHVNPSACGLSDLETTKYTEVNEAFCTLFGFTTEEVIGKSAMEIEILTNDTRVKLLQFADKNGTIRNVETDLKTKNGEIKHVIISAENIEIQNKKIRYTIVTDITERVRTTNRLKESEEKFRLLAENSSDSIWTMNLEGKYTYISPAIFKLRGYTPEEVMQQNYKDALSPNSIEKANRIFTEAVTKIKKGIKPDSQTVEIELIKKDGSTVWAEIAIDIIFDTDDNFSYFLGVSRNIDERKYAEVELKTRKEQLKTLINATPDFICFKDGEDRWQIANQTAIELYDLQDIDYRGKTDEELGHLMPTHEGNHTQCKTSDSAAWAKGGPYSLEEIVQKSDGSKITFDVIKTPLFNEDGSRKGLVILGRDITEKKRITDEIIESRIRYKALSNASFESIFISEKGVCVEQNKTAELNFGFSNEEAIGRMGTEWIVPEDREMVMQRMMSGNEEPYEATALRKDGTTFPCILRGRMMQYKGKDVRITSLTDISAQKSAENALKQSEEKYRLIFENAPLGILTYDENGSIAACNEEFARIIGSSRDVLINLNMMQLPDPRVLKSVGESLQGIISQFEGEYASVTANKTTQGKAIFAPIFNSENRVTGGVAIIEDITEQKHAEDQVKISEIKYKTLFQTSPAGILVLDQDGIIRELNNEILKTTKYSAEELIGESILKLAPETDLTVIKDHICHILNGEILEDEVVNRRKDGTLCYFHIRETAIQLPDGKRGILTVSNDITERKIVEQKLQESQRILLQAQEVSKIGSYETNIKTGIWTSSSMLDDIFGIDETFVRNIENWGKLIAPEYREKLLTYYYKVMHQNTMFDMEYKVIRPCDGSERWVHALGQFDYDATGNPIRQIGTIQDITERKIAENKIIESEKRLQAIIDASPVPMALNDDEMNITFVNNAFVDTFGYTLSDIPKLPDWWNKAYPDAPYRKQVMMEWAEELQRSKKTKTQISPKEVKIVCKNGDEKFVNVSATALSESYQGVQLVILYDITHQKEIETQLRENENYLLETQSIAQLGTFTLDFRTGTWTSSAILDKLFGIDKSYDKSINGWLSIVHPEWRKIMSDYFQDEVVGKLQNFDKKYLIVRQNDGVDRWLRGIAELKLDEQNKPTLLIGSIEDISELEDARIEITKSREEFKTLYDKAPIGYHEINKEGIFVRINDAELELFGYSYDEMIGRPFWQFAADSELSRKAIRDKIATGKVLDSSYERTIRRKDGTHKFVLVKDRILRAPNNEITGIQSTVQDITDRKNSEKALAKSEEKFRLIAENTSDGIFAVAPDGRITYASPSYRKITGYSDEVNLSHTAEDIYSIIHPDDRDDIFKLIYSAIDRKEEALGYTYRAKHKEGHYLWREDNARFTYDENKNYLGAYVICRDITERKNNEIALKNSEQKFSSILENSPFHIWAFDGTAYNYVNKSYFEFTGISHLESIHIDIWNNCIHPDDLESSGNIWADAWATKKEHDNYFRLRRYDGEYREFWCHATPVFDENNEFLHFQGFNIDINDRVVSEKKYEQLFNEMQDGFALHEIICDENNQPVDYRFLSVNKSFERQTGLKGSDIIGKRVLEVLPQTEKFWIDIYGEVALSGHPTTFENYSSEIGRFFQVTAFSHAHGQFAALVTDITSRKEAEAIIKDHQHNLEELVNIRTKELMVRETYLSAIIDNHPGMFWMKDVDGRFIFSNRANSNFLRLLYGEKANTLIGKSDFDFCPPYQAKSYLKEDKSVIKTRKEVQLEDRMTVDNKEYWFQKLKFPVIDSNNKTIGVAGYSIDITERINKDYQLRLQSEAFESFALSIIITDAHGNIEWCNTACEKLTGYSMKELIGVKTSIFRSENQSEEFYRHLWKTVHAGLVWSGEFVNKRKDGSTYYEESTITPVRNKDGIISHFIAIKINISERKEMEEALRQSEERWQFAIEGTGDGIYDCDVNTFTFYYSPQWKALLGYKEDEIGVELDEWLSRIHPDDVENSWVDAYKCINGEMKTYSDEHRLRCKDGTYKWMLTRGIALKYGENGKASRILGVMSDITEVKKLEESLRKNIEKERELNEMKTRFVANASHEFRTPLASILITSDSLIHYWERYNQEQVREKLDKIKSNTEFLTAIVEDMLQLSKIEEGKLELNLEPTNIVALSHIIVDGFKDEQFLNRIEFESDFEELTINIDARLFRQAVNNLMSNALKYSLDNSKVLVRLTKHDNNLELIVRDFGIGIPEADQKHLFTPYFRASNTKMIKGNGLGLNIIRGIVRMHGGEITFESIQNEGSSFTIHLPLH
ncbi:MAG: PAS domain S-box protein [Bacteroidales bacterium]